MGVIGLCISIRKASCSHVSEFVPLWADHWWRHQAAGQRTLCSWPTGGDRARQLPAHYRRFIRASENLSQPGPHRAVWLSTNHPRRHQTLEGKTFFMHREAKHSSLLFLILWILKIKRFWHIYRYRIDLQSSVWFRDIYEFKFKWFNRYYKCK